MDIYDRQREIMLCMYKSCLIAGLGGVGSWVALLLSLSGAIEEITLIDPDKVEASNLNRTPYKIGQVGQYKAIALAELLIERRPSLVINPIPDYLENQISKIDSIQLFIDCRDKVDHLSEKSPIIGGYDKDRISLSINYRDNNIFDSGLPGAGYTGAWVVPPVIVASMIVQYLVWEAPIHKTVNKTLSIGEVFSKVIGG